MKDRIKRVRQHSSIKLSQEAFGKRLGVTGAGISRIESGARGASEQIILAICREFNVNEEWLRTGEGDMFAERDDSIMQMLVNEYHLSPRSRALMTSFLQLTDEQQETITFAIEQAATNIQNAAPLAAAERAEKEKQLAAAEKQVAALRAELGIIPTDAPRKHISAERRAELHAELDRQLDEEEEKTNLESQAFA